MATASQKLKEYEKTYNSYVERTGNLGKYEESLRKEITDKTNGNQDLIDRERESSQELMALPSQLRAQFFNSNIRNPLLQEAVIGDRRGSVMSGLNALQSSRESRNMRFEDILNNTMKKENADLERQRLSAEGLYKLYETLQQQENFNRQMARGSGGGGGGGFSIPALPGGEQTGSNPLITQIQNEIANRQKSEELRKRMAKGDKRETGLQTAGRVFKKDFGNALNFGRNLLGRIF